MTLSGSLPLRVYSARLMTALRPSSAELGAPRWPLSRRCSGVTACAGGDQARARTGENEEASRSPVPTVHPSRWMVAGRRTAPARATIAATMRSVAADGRQSKWRDARRSSALCVARTTLGVEGCDGRPELSRAECSAACSEWDDALDSTAELMARLTRSSGSREAMRAAPTCTDAAATPATRPPSAAVRQPAVSTTNSC